LILIVTELEEDGAGFKSVFEDGLKVLGSQSSKNVFNCELKTRKKEFKKNKKNDFTMRLFDILKKNY
jgi:hypothetical protein